MTRFQPAVYCNCSNTAAWQRKRLVFSKELCCVSNIGAFPLWFGLVFCPHFFDILWYDAQCARGLDDTNELFFFFFFFKTCKAVDAECLRREVGDFHGFPVISSVSATNAEQRGILLHLSQVFATFSPLIDRLLWLPITREVATALNI